MKKQGEFEIKIHSRVRLIIVLAVTFIPVSSYMPVLENKILNILQFILIFGTSLYLASIAAMGRAKVIFTENSIFHIWQRRFIFDSEKNIEIPINMIDSYSLNSDKAFIGITIKLKNKTRYKIEQLHFILPIKDDFEKLENMIAKLSNTLNNDTNTC